MQAKKLQLMLYERQKNHRIIHQMLTKLQRDNSEALTDH